MSAKTTSKESREDAILRAADAVLLDVGVQNFTIDQVVDYLGVAKGTFYKYYQSKDDILTAVGIKALRLLLSYFKASSSDLSLGHAIFKSIIMSCYEYQKVNARYFELLVYMERPGFASDHPKFFEVSHAVSEYITGLIEALQKDGVIRADIDKMDMNLTIWGTCMGMMNFIDAKEDVLEEYKVDRKKIIENYAELLASGMKV